MFQHTLVLTCAVTAAFHAAALLAQPPQPTRTPLLRVVDLKIGESQTVKLCDGSQAEVQLLDLQETRDTLREAIRTAIATVKVNGETVRLTSGTYHLPNTIAGVRIDCPVTRGYQSNAHRDGIWNLEKDVRLRLWPADSPLLAPGTFTYPVNQRWFASDTQMANDPCYVDGGEQPRARNVYYHYGLDIGGAEGMVDVLAATDGLAVSAGEAVLPGYKDTPVAPRYDVVYLLDDRGWYYRYSHLQSMEESIKPGRMVKMGQKMGVLGKEGGSGGWSHLHFDIFSRLPSGKWGVQEGYAFLWEAYHAQHKPKLIAVARPHHFAAAGEEVTLDGSRSWSQSSIQKYEWTFADGTAATGAKVKRTYPKPGSYSEILKVTDAEGRVDCDFAVVQIVDRDHPAKLPATIHAAYSPTFDITTQTDVTFKVRTFRTGGGETWDFGDGSPKVKVQSDGNAVKLAKDGYAVTTHRFKTTGDHIVRVEHTDKHGYPAIAHLHVRVEERPLKVFVLAGTSNMHGANAKIDSLPEDLRQPQPNVLVYEKGEWSPLEAGKNLVGNDATFAQAMTAHLGEPIGLIRIRVGSAAERSKGASINNIVQQSREAGRSIEISGMLLDVSFRDGINEETAKAYAENLPRWVATMREEIGDASLPIAMNRAIPPVPRTPYLDLVRSAQDQAKLPHFRVFNCDDVSRSGDNVHFDTAGRLEMGRRFAAAIIELMKPHQQ